MGARAVLFAITGDDLAALDARAGSEELVDCIVETIGEPWDEEWLCELDRAWDAIYRSLTDGSLHHGAGSFPLNSIAMGRESLGVRWLLLEDDRYRPGSSDVTSRGPLDGRSLRKPERRNSFEPATQRNPHFHARQIRADAPVDACAECDMTVDLTVK